MSIIADLQEKNPHLQILPVSDVSFKRYGKLLSGIPAEKATAAARRMWKVADNVDFAVSVPEFEADTSLMDTLSRRMYAGMPIEIGWVFGRNYALNALEYHQGSEVIVVLEDVVLLVAHANDITWEPDAYLETSKVRAFFVPRGTIVEMPSWCLHFAPVNVSRKAGFCNLFALPRGTGTPNDFKPIPSPEGKLIAGTNLWMIVHPDAVDMVRQGRHPGLRGKNIVIEPLD
jgi:hypothetical protein